MIYSPDRNENPPDFFREIVVDSGRDGDEDSNGVLLNYEIQKSHLKVTLQMAFGIKNSFGILEFDGNFKFKFVSDSFVS